MLQHLAAEISCVFPVWAPAQPCQALQFTCPSFGRHSQGPALISVPRSIRCDPIMLMCCRRAALAVAVGSIVRSKGGIALQSTLNLTAGTLLAAAQLCPGPAQLWLLHGMWLIVNSAGPAFLPHVTVRVLAAASHGIAAADITCILVNAARSVRSVKMRVPKCISSL